MAISKCWSPGTGMDLGLAKSLLIGHSSNSSSSPEIGVSVLSEQRRGLPGTQQQPQWLELQQVFRFSRRCLTWKSNGSLGAGLSLQQPAAGGLLLLGNIRYRGRGVAGGGFGSASRKGKVRILASNSSSSSSSASSSSSVRGGSSEVDTTNRRKDSKRYNYDGNGKLLEFEDQSIFQESDHEALPGGVWESEQQHHQIETELSERNNTSSHVSTRNFEESPGEEENGAAAPAADAREESESWEREGTSTNAESSGASSSSSSANPGTLNSVGPKEPVYEVIEVSHLGKAVKKLVSRRQLLRTSGLRLRDLRRVDPSLWVTNSAPALLIRDQAILLNLGSLRAIASTREVLVFDHQSKGARFFLETLIPRLNDHQNGTLVMPFELEVIESALISRTQRLERQLMDVEPRVLTLLEVLPTCMTADVLEELRVSKQALVEIGAKAGALRQMLLELLEHPQDIRRMVIMGRMCSLGRDSGSVDCIVPQDKQESEDEEEEMEMLLEYYLQRCESTHGQAEKLLSSAKEMEDSIAVNLSSRRLEVSRLELLLQVGTFCAALGALVAGIFGMNLKSYLEERALAFWFTTAGIIFGGIALFIYMFSYLSRRKIL